MKLRMSFKDPSAINYFFDSIGRTLVENSILSQEDIEDMDEEQIIEKFEESSGLSVEEALKRFDKFVYAGESITIELDLDTNKASIVQVISK